MNGWHKKAASWGYLLGTVSCAGLMTLSPATRALAADSEQASENASLEEITVTAQRREENAQTVPITVDTVSGDDALRRGTTSIQSLAATIPNLTFTTASFATNTYIRGVGDNSASPNNEPSAAVYVDGVYNPASMALTAFNFNNISQIEVLKGPQGTLFGRNATAGVIQIITPDPKQEFSGKVDAGIANYQTVSGDAYMTGGVTSTLAADLAVLYFNEEQGFGRDLTTGSPNFRQADGAARTKWLWEPSDSTKVRFSADYGKMDSGGNSNQFLPISFPPYAGRYNSTGTPVSNQVVQWGASVKVDQDIGESLHGVSISSYRNVSGDQAIDSDLLPALANEIIQHYDSHYVTQEFQLTNRNPGRITWLVGAFYYGNQVFGSDPRTQTGTQIKNGYTAIYGVQDTSSGSVFAQATADLGWDTKLTLGARYTDEILKAFTKALNRAGVATAGPFDQSFDNHPVTWRAAFDHQFMPDLLGYVSYNKGFKSGGYNLSSPGSAPFFPEHVDAYEVGLKSEFMDHRLRVNVAGFYYNYTDLQVAVVLGGNQLFENAAAARNYGMDGSIDFAATENLMLSAGLGLLNAKYVSYPGARGYTPFGKAFNIPNAAGADLPFAPPVTGFLSADYRLPTAIGVFKGTITWSYNDVSYITPDMGLERPAYSMLNASVEWRLLHDNSLAVRLWGKNLTSADYYLFASESATGWYGSEGPPRQFGVTVEKDF
jgi:iron complex outermembrane recepter protein